MTRVFITGDTHGYVDRSKLESENWPVQNSLTKNDYLIIAGDTGIRWQNSRSDGSLTERDQDMISWYSEKPYSTLFIDGNHDNHYALNSYPVTDWHGGKVHQLSNSVFHLMRGQIYSIGGRSYFTMGGAVSTDKYRRIEGESWWPEEIPSEFELEEAITNLKRVNMTVDYVITHCCGTSLLPCLLLFHYDSDELTVFFDQLEFTYKLSFGHWFFGHYHRDKTIDGKYTCLYNDIEEIT